MNINSFVYERSKVYMFTVRQTTLCMHIPSHYVRQILSFLYNVLFLLPTYPYFTTAADMRTRERTGFIQYGVKALDETFIL